ncbi:MAG: FHA domain-containing protein [Gammaproteobacteria bacterium]|nr:FHA domain-containing protein [Gammaproteobacteria bacterium]
MTNEPQPVSLPDLQVEQEPSFAFLTHCYRNALDRLTRVFTSGRPLGIIIGASKSASDSVIRAFISSLDEDTVIARVTEPCVDATDLMRKIVLAAGFEPKDMMLADLQRIFTMFLTFQKSHKRRTVVCLEELQDSECWVLDMIRKLVETEVEGQYGLLVIMAGRPGLKELLNTRPLSSISTLAGYRIQLAPFTLAETTECIRLRVESRCTSTVGEVFQYQAIALIHDLCAGVPDAITSLVDQSMDLARREGVGLVTTTLVKCAYEASRVGLHPHEGDADAPTVAMSEVDLSMRRLIVNLTGDDAREQALRQGHTLIGRSRLCDIRIDSSIVSRHHALINYSGDGSAVLVDLGSRNGTFVDGYRITAHELVAGESIRVGNCTIEYIVDDPMQASFERAARSAGIAIGSKSA